MFSLGSSHRFYLYDSHCDMRKSFDGLCGYDKLIIIIYFFVNEILHPQILPNKKKQK